MRLGKRILASAMAAILAVGLMPLPAFAGNSSGDAMAAAGSVLITQGTKGNPTYLTLGKQVSGYASDDNDQWYSFTATSRHSAYSVRLVSRTDGESVTWNMYDSYGDYLTYDYTRTVTTKSVLLTSGQTYSLKLSNRNGADYELSVTEVPSNPQYSSLGKDKNNPYALTLGKAVNSQFDDADGRQEQWFEFTTTSRHSAYSISLFSRTDDKYVSWDIYDSYGNYLTYDRTSTKATKNVLLSTNSTYRLKLSASYGASTGFPSYELSVTEVPSNPQYSSLGKDKNNPMALALGQFAYSQFDDRDGSQEQWYTFFTNSSKKPYFISLTSKTSGKYVNWELYDYYGNYVTYDRTSTTSTKAVNLEKNMQYKLKVSGSYDGDSGYTSYQIYVGGAKPGKVNSLKLKAGKRSFTAQFKTARFATGYQIAYKLANAKKWTKTAATGTKTKVKYLKAKKKYMVKVRSVYTYENKAYYGTWSSVKKVKTKK